MGLTDPTADAVIQASSSLQQIRRVSFSSANSWVSSARFLVAWIFPALLGFYLKWYMMAEQSGFAREAQSMGLHSLNFYERISFFRFELLYGLLLVPAGLLILNRYLGKYWAAALNGGFSLALSLLLGVQIFSLKEFGRFSSFKMLLAGLSWGWHEPGSNAQYLMSGQALATLVAMIAAGCALLWAVRHQDRAVSPRSVAALKIAGELFGFVVVAALLLGLKSEAPASPYHQSSFMRAITSLWKENAVETGEFSGMDIKRASGLVSTDLSNLSNAELTAMYRQLTRAPEPTRDERYFGKASGANILFFILETTPQKYLPVGEDLRQFPNFNALQQKSFVGMRHYTTFPITRSALFSVFSSWYPIDDPGNAFDSPSWDSTNDFLRRLNLEGYKTEVFSPLRAAGVPDASLFEAVGFSRQAYPAGAITGYDKQASWQDQRIAADVETLHLLESRMDQWMKHGDHFVAAFLPQIAHSPYPDGETGSSAPELQKRGQEILKREDAWLGEIMQLLRRDGHADNTIIVVVGDHGLRTFEENPEIRRGTIDETAFHVPLLVYAPEALDHSEKISWLTSHIDLVPTILDLLGIQESRESEQGTAIWNPELAARKTFFFAKPMFGADGYSADGQFFMWHYFSDTIYKKPTAEFDPSDIIPRTSATAANVTTDISTMVAIEKAWHRRFSQIGIGTQQEPVTTALAN